jgi:3-oxoacyl-[acyl-carrier-protein] synthase II
MKRVVITGLGLLTSIGNNVEISWSNLISCRSGIQKIKSFETSDLPCQIAGYISHDKDDEFFYDQSLFLENRDINRNDRFIQYGLVAANSAIIDAGLNTLNDEQKLKVGVTVGSGIGGLETIYNGAMTLNERGPKKNITLFYSVLSN